MSRESPGDVKLTISQISQSVKLVVYFQALPISIVYVCDGASLVMVLLVLAVIHPGRCLPRSITARTLDKRALGVSVLLDGKNGKGSVSTANS